MLQDQSAYLLMYSPVSTRPQVWHLKQATCHWRCRASRDGPCLISSPQPAQSAGDEQRRHPSPGYRATWSLNPPVCVYVCVCGLILKGGPLPPLPLMNAAWIKVEV